MAGISPATLERIRAASDIVDVIGAYLPLKKAGANFTALCPFHKEKTPSFNVNPHKQIFHCFGCHKGGDVFTFVKEYENIGFVDAVRRLAERAKIPLEFDSRPGEQQARHLKDQLLQIHDQIAQRWQNTLANEAAGQLARDYLKKRGVSADAIKLFRLGAAPDAWDDTVNWARSKNHEPALVEKAGLILRKAETGNYYDRFRGRLMFPICDEQGRVIGFSGRVLSGDEKTAKYVNSPETPIFTKSKVFFGLDKSKRAILDAGFAIVCEGQLDLIACFMAGVQNVVAPQGTAFTDQHARILKRYVKKIVLCFDSDNAGQNASVRSLDTLLASGPELFVRKRDNNSAIVGRVTQKVIGDALKSELAISVAIVPAPHDPDSFIKEFGVASFQRLIDGAQEFFDYFLNRLCAENDAASDLGRRTILQAMREAVQKTGDAVLIDKYAQKTALRLGVSPESVRNEFKKNKPSVAEETEQNYEIPEIETISVEERQLLLLLLGRDDYVDWIVNHLKLEWLSTPIVREIVTRRAELHRQGNRSNVTTFLSEFSDSPKAVILLTDILSSAQEIGGSFSRSSFANAEKQLVGILAGLRNQFLDQQISMLMQKINQPQTDDAKKIELLREQQKLREQKRTPLLQLRN